jgi:hypothetical protein
MSGPERKTVELHKPLKKDKQQIFKATTNNDDEITLTTNGSSNFGTFLSIIIIFACFFCLLFFNICVNFKK